MYPLLPKDGLAIIPHLPKGGLAFIPLLTKEEGGRIKRLIAILHLNSRPAIISLRDEARPPGWRGVKVHSRFLVQFGQIFSKGKNRRPPTANAGANRAVIP